MGVAENKQLVRRFYEAVWDRGNVEFAHEVFADDYVRHDLRPTQALPGAAGMARIASDFRQAFPHARWHVDLLFGEGDFVVARWTATGTFLGEWGAVAPTGRSPPSRGSTSTGSARMGRSPSFGTTGTISASWSRSGRTSTPELHPTRSRQRAEGNSRAQGTFPHSGAAKRPLL
jgi:predicted SnoaL-like aldol condensation-catalyzing enzyme